MKHEFKPGDLAMIVGARRRPEAIGKVVELIELLQPQQAAAQIIDGTRFVNSDDEPCWLVTGDTLRADAITCGVPHKVIGVGMSAPRFLMPLRGDEHDDLITTERPTEPVSA